ncbi:peptidylprolyl isomerase [Cyanobacteria bacterium FACHB-DQ100]|nr:peptidylprolyl isomerase [Cyanobacteria bacterium FACHB-DQ100]
MSTELTVSPEEVLYQVKLSGQIPMILEEIAKRKAIVAAAEEAGITVESEELQQAADAIRLKNNLHRSKDTLTWLKKQGLSLNEFEILVHTQVLADKLAEHLFGNEVEAFFAKNQLDYAKVVMYEIVLDDEDLAIELFYATQEGEVNFHELAHQYIQNMELRRAGGYKGLLRRIDLNSTIAASVFASKPPQILKPILVLGKSHLIFVEEIIQPELDAQLRNRILIELFSNWLKHATLNLSKVMN